MKWGIRKRDSESNLAVNSFRNEIERVFDDFFSFKPSTLFESDWLPSVNVEEDEKEIHVTAEIPGLDEKDLNVTIEDGYLTISGEKNEETRKEDKKKNYLYSERKFGSFYRTITLPEGIKADQVKAKYKKGVLNITVPKDETAKPKKINITVN